MARGPIEHVHRIALGNPRLQDLAGLVPVDQEYQRCADRFEEGVAGLIAVGQTAAGDEVEHLIVAQARRAFAFQPAPLHGKFRSRPVKNFARTRCTSV